MAYNIMCITDYASLIFIVRNCGLCCSGNCLHCANGNMAPCGNKNREIPKKKTPTALFI